MKVARFPALAFLVLLTLLALSGSLSMAAAQGATGDVPSGYGKTTQMVRDPEFGTSATLSPAQRLAYQFAQFSPSRSGWGLVGRHAGASMNRSAGSSGEHRSQQGPLSQQWARPVGR